MARISLTNVENFGNDFFYEVTIYNGKYPCDTKLCHTLREAQDYARANAAVVEYGEGGAR